MAVVTIIGGHGKIALLAEPLLVERGHTVNALIHRPEQSEDIVTRGANPVVTDITALSTEEMAKLLTELGTEVLVWSAGAGGVGRHVGQLLAVRAMQVFTRVIRHAPIVSGSRPMCRSGARKWVG